MHLPSNQETLSTGRIIVRYEGEGLSTQHLYCSCLIKSLVLRSQAALQEIVVIFLYFGRGEAVLCPCGKGLIGFTQRHDMFVLKCGKVEEYVEKLGFFCGKLKKALENPR